MTLETAWNALCTAALNTIKDMPAPEMFTLGRRVNKSTLKTAYKINLPIPSGISAHQRLTIEQHKATLKSAYTQFETALKTIDALNSDYAMPTLKFYPDGTVVWLICGIHIGGMDKGVGVSFDKNTTPLLLARLAQLPMPTPNDNVWMLAKPAGPRPVGATAEDAYALFYTLQCLPMPVVVESLPNPLPEIGLCHRATVDRKTLQHRLRSL